MSVFEKKVNKILLKLAKVQSLLEDNRISICAPLDIKVYSC